MTAVYPDYVSTWIVCGQDLVLRRVRYRDGWWVVEDARTGECLSGGFTIARDAIAHAQALGSTWGRAS